MSFIGAGIVFLNKFNSTILAGYNIKINSISGIGGKSLENEDLDKTAIREMLEELFELQENTNLNNYINLILAIITPSNIINSNNYYIHIYNFEDLQQILNILNLNNIKSKLYDIFPTNLTELIFNRKINEATEISNLCLLPITCNLKFAPDFLQDLDLIQK
jgi:hypothetical protein